MPRDDPREEQSLGAYLHECLTTLAWLAVLLLLDLDVALYGWLALRLVYNWAANTAL